MPPCIATSIPRLATTTFRLKRKLGSYRRLHGSTQPERSIDSKLPHSDTLTAIHRANVILPKVLPSAKSSHWVNLLCKSGDTLTGAVVRRHRIAVLGLDELCRPNELISALLDDPLVSDRQIVRALRNRRTLSPNDPPLTISQDEHEDSSVHLCLRLPWLRNLNVDVMEIPLGHPDAVPLLYDANVQILVTSSLASPLPLEFRSLLLKPGLFLVLDYPVSDQFIVEYTVSQLTQYFPTIFEALMSKMLRVYPLMALSALDAFREGSNSLDAIQTFQNDFLRSGLTALSQSITGALSSDRECQRAEYARSALTGALEACRIAAQANSHDIAVVQKFIEDLRSQIFNAQSASIQEVLGGKEAPEVGNSVERSTREMQVVMNAIPWWKLPFKIDDLSGVLFHAVERVWCRDLHAKLVFQTGRLACLRSNLTSGTLKNLHLLPTSFHSAVLVNQLHQLSTRPPELAPDTLTQPLSYRLQQLQESIHCLHRRAQHAILSMSLMALGSAGGSYAGWITGWVTPATSVGLGALGIMVSLRWFVGRWEKGKERWWEDWSRAGNGLERDIKGLLELVVAEKISSVPSKAADDLQNMVMEQSRKLDKLNKELESIEVTYRHPPSDQNGPVKQNQVLTR